MNKGKSSYDKENGERIYDKVQTKIDENKSRFCAEHERLSSSYSSTQGQDFKEESYSSAEQVLDVLNYHIDSLDNLQKLDSSLSNKVDYSFHDVNENISLDEIFHLNTTFNKTSAHDKCAQNRKLALDHYLRETIKGRDECACHFQHYDQTTSCRSEPVKSSLVAGSANYYSRESSLNERLIGENSRANILNGSTNSLISSLTEASNSDEAIYIEREDVYLLDDLKRARCCERQSHGLFIEGALKSQKGEPVTAPVRETTTTTTSYYDREQVAKLRKHKAQNRESLFYDNKLPKLFKQTEAQCKCCCADSCFQILTNSINCFPFHQSQTLQNRSTDSYSASERVLTDESSRFNSLLNTFGDQDELEISSSNDDDESVISEPGNTLEGLSDAFTCNSDRDSPEPTSSIYTSDIVSDGASLSYRNGLQRKKFCSLCSSRISCLLTQASIEKDSLSPHNLKSSRLTKNHSSLSLTQSRNFTSSIASTDALDRSYLKRKRSSLSCGPHELFRGSDDIELDDKAYNLPLDEIINRAWASSSLVKEGCESESKDNYTSGKCFPVSQVRRNQRSLSSNNCDECRFVREASSSAHPHKLRENVRASSSGEESKDVFNYDKDEEYAKSMRTARDIARLSIPSLSALQYLPNQIDSNNKFLISKSNNNNKIKSDTKMKSNTKSESKINTVKGIYAESKEDIHSDQSSLLRRLCSCNCLAKSQQNMAEQEKNSRTVSHEAKRKKSYLAKNLHSAGNSSIKDYTETNKKRTRSHASESSSLADTKRSSDAGRVESESSKRCSDIRSRVEVQSKADEKQYPRFLDILNVSHNLDDEKEASLTMRGNMPVVERDFHGKRRRDIRNSECDGVSTPLSSSRDGSDPDTTNESAYSFLRTRSSSFATDSRVTDSLDSKENLRPHSVCSTFKEESRKRYSPFKRFLSPSKLFASASEDFNEVQKEESTKRSWKKDSHLSKNQPSFFRRSINRLSERKGSPKTVLNTNSSSRNENNLEESASIAARYLSASPSISVSFCDSLAGSEDSIDNELPHSLGSKLNLSQAPEINLNLTGRTSDLGVSDDTKSNISMGRSCDAENLADRKQSRFNANLVIGEHSLRGSCEHLKSDFEPSNAGCSHSLPSSPFGSKLNVDRHSDLDEYKCLYLSHSPKPFHSPITQSSKIEDGLKVCSTEHFEKHIGNIKNIEIEAQKRLFQAWINHFSPNLIQHDLFDELRDGIKLIGLLASLTHDKQLHYQYQSLRRDKLSVVHRLVITPTSRLKHLSNVSIVVDYLRQRLGMKLINLNPMDIVSGKPNVILGLCWNIILKFQLEQTNVHYLDSFNEASQCEDSRVHYTSRLSSSSTNEDRVSKSTKERKIRKLQNEFEEYSTRDLVIARKRLLHHVNKRFNLKLTNLTSNLMDGDVMLLILKNVIATQTDIPFDQVFDGDNIDWSLMSNDEKLDNCFSIAEIHLGVPRLFEAIDLKKQTISDNNSKPLLVYLSMLLNTNSKGESLELLQENLLTSSKPGTNNFNLEAQLILDAIDCEDKFKLDKLQSTLIKLNELEKIIAASSREEDGEKISAHLVTRCKSLRENANEIEALIIWINEADNLFEKTCSTAAELSKAIVEYGNFFSPSNVPKVTAPLCSTLERQYRECLSFAKQRVLLMEQTLKNWAGYENSKGQLKDWLSTAESKLSQALSFNEEDETSLEYQTRCLEELIDYFELEECDTNIEPATGFPDSQFNMNEGDSLSVSGSVLSLMSTSSRASNLQSSKKAKYIELFNEFELNCRLLSTMLDSGQKDALLLGVRELRQRLRYITEQKVPQVVNDLRSSIEQSKLLKKEVELCVDESAIESGDRLQSLVMTEETLPLSTQDLITGQVSDVLDSNNSNLKGSPPVPLDKLPTKSKRVKRSLESGISKNHNFQPKNKTDGYYEQEEVLTHISPQISSFLSWLFPESERPTTLILDGRNKKLARNSKSPNTKGAKKSTQVTNQESGPDDISYVRLLWQKIVRAYRASVSLNIVLLICLAGICVVPLIQQNACCELAQNHISTDTFAMNEKPT